MKDSLLKQVRDFLSMAHVPGRPVLIGLSGGEDSSALFSLLLECRTWIQLDLHVAHMDHGWREESAGEARALQAFVQTFSVPFHLKRACRPGGGANLEDQARNERFSFFREIYLSIGAQGLVLAHQREDQAETVLKRILEGAGALALGGMQAVSSYQEMNVWRPLLKVSRQEIEHWNLGKDWIPIQDRTNQDVRFLRARMRKEVFPWLEESFGKKVKGSLVRIGEEVSLLRRFVEKRMSVHIGKVLEGSLGSFLPYQELKIEDAYEKRELLRFFLQERHVSISRSALQTAVCLLEQGASNKRVDVSEGHLWIEGGNAIWLPEAPPVFFETAPLQGSGLVLEKEGWRWEIEKSARPKTSKQTLWNSYLEGAVSFLVEDQAELYLTSYDDLGEKEREKASLYFAKNKIPSKMRKMFPFISNHEGLIYFDLFSNADLISSRSSVFVNVVLKKISN